MMATVDPMARYLQDESKLRAQLAEAQEAVSAAEQSYASETFSPEPSERALAKYLADRARSAEKVATVASALQASGSIRARAQAASAAAIFETAAEERRSLFKAAQAAQKVLKAQIEAIADSQRRLAQIELADSNAATVQHAANASGGLARAVAGRMVGISMAFTSGGDLHGELASAVRCLENVGDNR